MFYKKHKNFLIILLTLSSVLGVGLYTMVARAAGTPPDYNKIYIYDLQSGNTCLGGDFVEYASINPNTDSSKVTGNNPFACVRLKRGEPLGYSTSPLTTNNACKWIVASNFR